ncbi:uncharacterized protein PAC_16174 [Phialocephala subalpina]|uniref:Heterokaryon incompatibility domain-containing protein n=1 Tax=Phialocephala subalpina TaxID=576137 RepID=A0A1L7XML9_9HELO|nr:uncharacterized protein PAC_16174 [Phialocephala subalpina]
MPAVIPLSSPSRNLAEISRVESTLTLPPFTPDDAWEIGGNIAWGCSSQYWVERHKKSSEKLGWVETHGEVVSDWAYFGFKNLNFQWPDMRRWCDLIREYGNGEREMTNDYDAINAIAGLINVMEHVSVGGRECKGIPSWSFLGWKECGLDLFWWKNSMDHVFLDETQHRNVTFSSDCEVGSIVNWFKQDQACTKLIPIANQFHTCRSQWVNELPQSWSRDEEDSTSYYTHESIQSTEFRYPIALPQTSIRKGRLTKEQFSQYLFFKAERGWLNIGTAVGQDLTIEYTPIENMNVGYITVSLVDDDGRWRGAIRLPFIAPTDILMLPDAISKDLRFELIAIATGKLPNKAFPKCISGYGGYAWSTVPEWHCEERPKQAEFYEFYFVLWIEWQDGIAYRKGLGRVEKQAWEQLSLEEIDVKLG